MSEPIQNTLISVVVGAILGLGSSFAFATWQSGSANRALRHRLRQELELIRKDYERKLEAEEYGGKAYFTEFFDHKRADLVLAMNAETFEAVIQAYSTIGGAMRMNPSNQVNARVRLEEAIKQIKSVEKML